MPSGSVSGEGMTLLRSLHALSVRDGDSILVAVSGGADSVCLLHLLKQLNRFPLHVAHLNHQFRKEADAEAKFVEALSTRWDIPATMESWPVEALCKQARLSKQEGARHLRYQFLTECAQRIGARWIATGHTADDQAETLLMRLLRGAGSFGLSGIPKIRNDQIIRPLLRMTRREILAELTQEGIAHIEDASNATPTYLRNRIRHRLIPLLLAENPNIQTTLCRTANLLEAENDFLRQSTQQHMPTVCLENTRTAMTLDVVRLQLLHPAIRRRVFQEGLARVGADLGSLRGIGFTHIEKLMELSSGPTGKVLMLSAGVSARRDYGRLILSRSKLGDAPPSPVTLTDLTGEPIPLPAWGIRLLVDRRYKPFSCNVASFDLDRISLPLVMRGWQAGDRFVPVGMNGRHKKLQDFFSDEKIPRQNRSRIPLLTCQAGIVWIVGHRADGRFVASEKTERVLSVEVRQSGEENHDTR